MRLLFWNVVYITAAMPMLQPNCGVAAGSRAKRVVAFREGSTFFLVNSTEMIPKASPLSEDIDAGGITDGSILDYPPRRLRARVYPEEADLNSPGRAYRLNYKLSSIGTTTIFAQATGFKVAWQLPTRNKDTRYRRNVDDVHETASLMYESHGFDGKSCIAKHICQVQDYVKGRGGTMTKILKLLTKTRDDRNTTADFDVRACEEHSRRCPLQLVGVDAIVE